MLTVGMYGKGLVGATGCSDADYRTQFALWCFYSAPLMLGCDIRSMDEKTLALVTNATLIRIDQDAEARPPICVTGKSSHRLVLFKHLDDNTYALGFFNLTDEDGRQHVVFSDYGLPAAAGYDVELTGLYCTAGQTMNCQSCGRTLTRDEIGLSRKLINRGTQTFFCIHCLARDFRVSEKTLRQMIERFREAGCSLFL